MALHHHTPAERKKIKQKGYADNTHKVARAIGKSVKAGVRRVVAPTEKERAKDEAARIDRQQAAKRAELRKARAAKLAGQPKKKKPTKSYNPFKILSDVLGKKKKD